ncbi:fructosamine kinase family protein [Tropicimonas sp.]|uniref:fructosamine kinase family protein n=1 Tax=Tropicimonas sp. TaxID=2067044 RepID=UPI003A86C2EF
MEPLRIARSLLGADIVSHRRLHGGDLSHVTLLKLSDGRRTVLKTGPLVDREARMLAAIRDAGAAAPAVLGVAPGVLLLEALDETAPSPQGWRTLGRELGRLHRNTGQDYGWPEDYAFGLVTIANGAKSDWPAFWAERRLAPELAHLPYPVARRLERLLARLPDLLPHAPPPALLHGDLWAGNALFGPGGAAHLIDPACYFGHAEVDLAMLHLFGAPGADFSDGYGPAEPGLTGRRPVYQLWPALVHLRLFGGGYRRLVNSCLAALGF